MVNCNIQTALLFFQTTFYLIRYELICTRKTSRFKRREQLLKVEWENCRCLQAATVRRGCRCRIFYKISEVCHPWFLIYGFTMDLRANAEARSRLSFFGLSFWTTEKVHGNYFPSSPVRRMKKQECKPQEKERERNAEQQENPDCDQWQPYCFLEGWIASITEDWTFFWRIQIGIRP